MDALENPASGTIADFKLSGMCRPLRIGDALVWKRQWSCFRRTLMRPISMARTPSRCSQRLVAKVMTIDEIIENFSLLEEWDDRYRYVIELGRSLSPLSERDRSDANKVQGCASQVWLATTVRQDGAGGPILSFTGDSDAHIVRGLIAILFTMFSGRHAREILATDAGSTFERLGLREHLTPQRSNGFRSMVERIRLDARAALSGAMGAQDVARCV
jgi:cysteine desulfuration protein SufE